MKLSATEVGTKIGRLSSKDTYWPYLLGHKIYSKHCRLYAPLENSGAKMTIKRVSGKYTGRCRAVSHNGLVYAVATDTSGSPTLAEQTLRTLEALEQNLSDAGSGKSGLLQVTIYIRDMTGKSEMDAVWCDWVGPSENWPQRACVGADLAGNDMIEIVAIATVL